MAEEQGNPYGQLIAKAWTDEEFKARLKADPKAAMKEVGIDIPGNHTVHVHEAAPDEHHLVIPPKPGPDELSDEDLDKVAGGRKPPLSALGPQAAIHADTLVDLGGSPALVLAQKGTRCEKISGV